MCVERSVAKTAAASVAATTAPRRTDSSQERSKSDVRGDAREEGADDDADRAQERRRHGDLAQAAPRGLEPALVQDQRKADHSDPAGKLRVVELDPARAFRAEQHPEREEGDEDGQTGAGGTQSDDEARSEDEPDKENDEAFVHADILSGGTRGRRVEHFSHGHAPAHAQDRPSLGDRAGRRPARLRLFLRAAQADGHPSLDDARRARAPMPRSDRSAAGISREMLDELGPTFVKFGQLLSTRPDVVPPDIVAELRGLQDDVRPFPFAQVRVVVEEELGLTLEQAFVRFDEQPIAAASIGQVHRAALPNGDEVVVKVQRPNAPAPDRVRPGVALPGRAHDQGARPGARLHRRTGARRRVRAIHPPGARLQARGAPRRHVPAQLRRLGSSSSCRRSTGTTRASRMLTLEFLDGVQLADLDCRGDLAGGAARACLPGHADLDGDDLPARVLPRRSASGERARARRGTGSASSTSGSSES